MKNKYVKCIAAALLVLCITSGITACRSDEKKDSSEVSQVIAETAEQSVESENSKEEEISTTPQPESQESSESTDTVESNTESTVEFPEEWQDNGIFSAHYQKAYELVQEMTLEEKVGQIILARCPSYNAVSEAKEYHLGGYVLFGQDFQNKTKNEITGNIRSYLNSQKIPMIIAVDEEGGTVSRLSLNSELTSHAFKSPRELFEEGGIDAIVNDTKEKVRLMKSLNINTNLAPVCDISKTKGDFMYERSLGQNPDITSDYVRKYTKVSQENGISVTLKHFPGYGNNSDTHTGVAIDKRTYETFVKNDFLPFKAGIDAGAHMVLVSHNMVECMDAEHPASLSPKVHEILRNELGFTGIIVTDDLAMDAISKYVTEYSPTVAAVLAGNDMLCVSDYQSACNDIINAAQNGTIEVEQIEQAATRVIAWKISKNML